MSTVRDIVELERTIDSRVSKTSDTGSAVVPTGTTAQRDSSPAEGYLRLNTTTDKVEVYNEGEWQPTDKERLLNVSLGPQLNVSVSAEGYEVLYLGASTVSTTVDITDLDIGKTVLVVSYNQPQNITITCDGYAIKYPEGTPPDYSEEVGYIVSPITKLTSTVALGGYTIGLV